MPPLKLRRWTMMTYVEEGYSWGCLSPLIPQHHPAIHPFFKGLSHFKQTCSLLLIAIRAFPHLVSALVIVLVECPFIDLLCAVCQCLSRWLPGSKSQWALEEDETLLYSWLATKSFWPYCQRDTLTLSLTGVLEPSLKGYCRILFSVFQ